MPVGSKEIGLEVNADKTEYMVTFPDKNEGRIQSINIDNISFERVEDFKHLWINPQESKLYPGRY